MCNLQTVEFPAAAGTYVLWFSLPDALTIQAGRLGGVTLPAGVVAYVGSARGPGGLRARLRRHLRADKPLHWHIDYLTVVVPVAAIWFSTAAERLECAWAQCIAAQPGVTIPAMRFGASDCTCGAHLFTVPTAQLRSVWDGLDHPHTVAHDPVFSFSG